MVVLAAASPIPVVAAATFKPSGVSHLEVDRVVAFTRVGKCECRCVDGDSCMMLSNMKLF
jgi:hypothetical protein